MTFSHQLLSPRAFVPLLCLMVDFRVGRVVEDEQKIACLCLLDASKRVNGSPTRERWHKRSATDVCFTWTPQLFLWGRGEEIFFYIN